MSPKAFFSSSYLDNAATTPLCIAAREAWLSACDDTANASSVHAAGRRAAERLKQSRAIVAGALDVPPDNLIFTSGGTESINLALRSALSRHKGRHGVTTALEHPAVGETLSAFRGDGFRVTELRPGRDGTVSPDAVLSALEEDTLLVSCVQTAGETGAVLDVDEIGRAIKERYPHILFHVDGVQGFLRCPFSPRYADYISISAHKVHAPMGIGALYIGDKAPFRPLFTGGGHEKNRRSGTTAWPLAAAFGAAVEAWTPVDNALMPYALRALADMGGHIIPGHNAPHIIACGFPGFPGEALVRMLSDAGVTVGSGSACHSGQKSKTLLSMPWIPPSVRDSVIRLSFSSLTTMAELKWAMAVLGEVVGTASSIDN